MKEKIHYVIEAVLAVAVIILFVFQFSGNKNDSTEKVPIGEVSFTESMPMAYISIDSLWMNYTYSIDLNDQLMRKYENSQANLTERMRKLQADYENFQRKVQTGSFLSEERAIQERDRLTKSHEDLQILEQKLAQEFSDEQGRTNEELRNMIITNLREYNKDKKYHIIYGKLSDNILYADEVYNITDEVVKFLNMKYAASPAIVESK